jgi:predicted permease
MTLEPLLNDIRLATRGLRRAKGFTLAAVLTLAVGTAGVTTMFALIRGVLLRPLPMADADRLVVVSKEIPASGPKHWPLQRTEVNLIRDQTAIFERVAAIGYNEPSLTEVIESSSTDFIQTARVTGDFFEILGVRPFLGRTLNRDDDTPGSERALVLTHGVWRRRYGGVTDVIGRRITLADQRFVIVGVMPPDVEYPRGVDAWMTVEARATLRQNQIFQQATRDELDVVARLQPGVSAAQAASALGALAAEFAALAPPGAPQTGLTSVVRPIADVIVGDIRAAMFVLFAAVGLVLLIACANVANLLLVRGEIRRPEMAVRVALGASRIRLASQIAGESFVLTMLAGAVGLWAAWSSLRLIVALIPGGLPRVDSIRIDGGVVIFVLGLTLVTTCVAALVPALAAGQVNLVSHVQAGGRAVTRRTRRRGVLVAAQVALAVTVVAAAGLVTRSLLRLQSTGTELGADRLALVSLSMPPDRYVERDVHLRFLEDLVARLQATPGISSATPINVAPFSGVGWDAPVVTAEGQDATQVARNGSLTLEAIQPGYFDTFGVTIVRGRAFNDRDRGNAPRVAIVSEDVAERLWPGQDPIDKRLKMGGPDSEDPWRTVVGVAARTRYRDLATQHATLYVPDTQLIVTAQSVVVRSTAPLARVSDVVREQVRATDPAVRVSRVEPFRELLREPLIRPRFYAFLLAVFGGSALLLSAIGLYAVIAASVRQRYSEIGVRLALGATPADVRRMVLREGWRLGLFGAAVGFALAVVVTQWLRGLLYEVHPLDPATLVTATLLLLLAGVVAAYLPARAAARMNPLVVLRDS